MVVVEGWPVAGVTLPPRLIMSSSEQQGTSAFAASFPVTVERYKPSCCVLKWQRTGHESKLCGGGATSLIVKSLRGLSCLKGPRSAVKSPEDRLLVRKAPVTSLKATPAEL